MLIGRLLSQRCSRPMRKRLPWSVGYINACSMGRLHSKQIRENGLVWFGLNILFTKTQKNKTQHGSDTSKSGCRQGTQSGQIDRDCKCKFSYRRLDKVVEIKQESGQSKLLNKLTSVKPLSKEQAKQKGQNKGKCTICHLKFQKVHGGPPYPPSWEGDTPFHALPTQLCLVLLH